MLCNALISFFNSDDAHLKIKISSGNAYKENTIKEKRNLILMQKWTIGHTMLLCLYQSRLYVLQFHLAAYFGNCSYASARCGPRNCHLHHELDRTINYSVYLPELNHIPL